MKTTTETDYTANAQAFLDRNGITCRITLSDTKPAQWQPSGHHYRVTLSKPRKNRLVFDFWGSLADAESGEKPVAYDVLSCISSDLGHTDSFKEFCGETGFSADSIKARQTFNRLSRFNARLQAFFTAEEIEQLSTIS